MADANATPSPHDASSTQPRVLFGASEIILIVLMVLAIVGIGITDMAPRSSYWYWIAMVPLFATGSIITERSRADQQGQPLTAGLSRQLLHWSGLLIAVYTAYRLLQTGQLADEAAALMMLLLLGLTTFLAGVHFDWRLCVVGSVLELAAVIAAWLEEYLWLLIVLAVIGVAAALWSQKHMAGRSQST